MKSLISIFSALIAIQMFSVVASALPAEGVGETEDFTEWCTIQDRSGNHVMHVSEQLRDGNDRSLKGCEQIARYVLLFDIEISRSYLGYSPEKALKEIQDKKVLKFSFNEGNIPVICNIEFTGSFDGNYANVLTHNHSLMSIDTASGIRALLKNIDSDLEENIHFYCQSYTS